MIQFFQVMQVTKEFFGMLKTTLAGDDIVTNSNSQHKIISFNEKGYGRVLLRKKLSIKKEKYIIKVLLKTYTRNRFIRSAVISSKFKVSLLFRTYE